MPSRNPRRLHIHLHSHTYSVGPPSVVWSDLGAALPLPPMRALVVQWSRALSLVCEVALKPFVTLDWPKFTDTKVWVPSLRCDLCICRVVSWQPWFSILFAYPEQGIPNYGQQDIGELVFSSWTTLIIPISVCHDWELRNAIENRMYWFTKKSHYVL